MKIKKLFCFLIISCLILPITSCSNNVPRLLLEDAEITLWTYPIGDWGNKTVVNKLIKNFNEVHPDISVKVKYLDYTSGDNEVEEAVKSGKTPDIILEGPERLVANWGRRGLMVDLSDLYTDDSKDIYENVAVACRTFDGKYYEYPLCMATHCMAINKRIFEEADALKYLNLTNYTWTTENFFRAVDAVYRSGHKNILSIYCKNKSGDQGSRALITNLYGGTYTDKSHLSYTIDSQKNITAITSLISSYGISIDPTLSSADEINKFRHGELAVSICWNPSYHTDTSIGPAGKTSTGDEIIPMHFPSLSGASKLAGGIWGFGIFDNKDKNKIKAAKIFIDYMANDEDGVRAAVKASHVFPVHKELTNIYSGSKIGKAMDTFSRCFMLSMGDYYQVTPGWPEVRSLWYETLQGIAGGNDIRTSLADCNSKANTIANQVKAEMNKQD